MFMDELASKILEKESSVCLGLDPALQGEAMIPRFIIETYEDSSNDAIIEFNVRILDTVHDLIPVVKPQLAFYLANDALDALKKTIVKAHHLGILVILDAKFNDIGNTSEAYASFVFDVLGADAVTVNGYLGTDSIEPFMKHDEKGIFVLVKTSNKSSGEFQDLLATKASDIVPPDATSVALENETLDRNYVHMARLISTWNERFTIDGATFNRAGAVIGATYPWQLMQLRNILSNTFVLIPGYGAQGATADDVKHGFTSEGTGAIVNSSRALLYAYALSKKNACDPDNFEQATRKETEQMRDEINAALLVK